MSFLQKIKHVYQLLQFWVMTSLTWAGEDWEASNFCRGRHRAGGVAGRPDWTANLIQRQVVSFGANEHHIGPSK